MPDAPNLNAIDESVFELRPEDKLLKTPRRYLIAGLFVDGLLLFCASIVLHSHVISYDQYYHGNCGFLLNTWPCTFAEYRWNQTMFTWLLVSPLGLFLILPPLIGYRIGKRKKQKQAA
jgi:hypothetical protein